MGLAGGGGRGKRWGGGRGGEKGGERKGGGGGDTPLIHDSTRAKLHEA